MEIKKRRCYHTLTDAGPAPIRAAQMTKFEEGAKNMKKMKRTLALLLAACMLLGLLAACDSGEKPSEGPDTPTPPAPR